MLTFQVSSLPSNATHTLENVLDFDVLIIPGGLGTRSPYLSRRIELIADTYPKMQYLLTVCTGSALTVKSGVLDGWRATTYKSSWSSVIAMGPKVEWVPLDGGAWREVFGLRRAFQGALMRRWPL
jgi:putative intracellular protease/amidase